MRTEVFFTSENFKLEGVLYSPAEQGVYPAAIVLHPHPQYGGSMANNVVDAICAKLEESMVALKFNCRGVGRSEGVSTGGKEEGKDVLAAINFLKSKEGVNKNKLIFIGYSWGTYVGLPVTFDNPDIQLLIAVACPVGLWNYSYMKKCKKPKLFITGTHDQFAPREKLESLYEKLPEPKELNILETDHFYWGQERQLANIIQKFLMKYF
ncbi:MAG: alpha/beta hydrolase [Candidatus Helarchaeota archaeon]